MMTFPSRRGPCFAVLRLITNSNKAPESFRADTGRPLQKVGSMLQALPIELAIAQEVLFSQHSLAIDDDVRTNRYSNASPGIRARATCHNMCRLLQLSRERY
jgi:hypothetical protein